MAASIASGKTAPLLPAEPLPDKLYVAFDGTGVPMVPAAAGGRAGKGEDGKARTREVKMAAAFTQTRPGDDGYPVRDRGSSS
ncbi:MAG TPA: ISKra4 family transposase, partial [Streptosporangiaceae bacterium]|nr:ISKra4 family transposase [Streptosporangiaceae bacterium]